MYILSDTLRFPQFLLDSSVFGLSILKNKNEILFLSVSFDGIGVSLSVSVGAFPQLLKHRQPM